jgi:hypothetical protein
MRAILVVPAAAACLLAAPPAFAGEPLRLSWQAPKGCPTADHVKDAALRASGDVGREPLEADVRVEHAERWTVTIRTHRANVAAAERHLEATSCAALADATAVILALALIPEASTTRNASATPAVSAAAAAAPAPEAEAAPAAAAPPPSRPPSPAAAPPPSPVASPAPAERALVSDGALVSDADRAAAQGAFAHALAASASLHADGTTLPSAAVGGRAALAWTPARVRLEVGGSYFSEQSKTTATSGAGAAFTLLVADARGCWAIARSARSGVELSPCIGADVEVVQARGFGAAKNYDANAAWVSATGGALLRVPMTSWLALRADAGAIVPFSRPRFVVEGDGAVHRPAPLGVRGGIGAELLFL